MIKDFFISNPFGVLALALIAAGAWDGAKKCLPYISHRYRLYSIAARISEIEQVATTYYYNVHIMIFIRKALSITILGVMITTLFIAFVVSRVSGLGIAGIDDNWFDITLRVLLL